MLSDTRNIFRGSALYLGAALLTSAAGFAVAVMVSRSFGEEGLGIYSVCLVLLLVAGLVADLGLNTLVMRGFATVEPSLPVSLRSILLLRLGSSLIVAFPVAAIEILFLSVSAPAVLVAASFLILLARAASGVLESVAKGMRRPAPVLAVSGISAALQAGAVAFILQEGGSFAEVFLALAATEIAKALMLLSPVMREVRMPGPGLTLQSARTLLQKSTPFAAMAFLSLLGDRVDVLLLAAIAGASQTGLYAAADRFLMAGIFVGYAFQASALPILSSTGQPWERDRLARRTFLPITIVSIACTALLWAASPLLIRFTFGFPESITLLRILLCALPAMVMNNVLRVSLFSFEKERSVVTIFAGASIGNLLLNLLLIPWYGAAGAAIVAVATEYGIALMYALVYGRLVPGLLLKQNENLVDAA